ncbi:glycosyltransferase family 2 protein [uncultured Curtobacterium sp.]|uniref:glycosyltransferase family 2 protein n=1 Tax=uncultured Curtobacterium sp. TaxID=331964 RepID=UPI00258E4AAE|nr:glycosyltransferase [uncultured Curtobacterium sp.]
MSQGTVRRHAAPHRGRPRIAVVVLTQGTRPADLRRGIDSVLAQRDVDLDVVCVGNGWEPTDLPEGVRALALPENLGIPAGRNAGAEVVDGDHVFFLDDDAWVPSDTFLRDAVEMLDRDPSLGLVQPRVVDPTGAANPRRWVPRIRKGDAADSSPVFSVWEGAVVLPMDVYRAVGGWGAEYFYAHEGIELAWRVWDAGRRAWYAGDLVANHPAIDPARHTEYYRLNARNRVWLARRNLPAPLRPLYVGSWAAIQVARWWRHPARLRTWFAGAREGWTSDCGPTRTMGWLTVARMTLAGRPPVV